MPASKVPGPGDSGATAQVLLDGLASGTDVFVIAGRLADSHPRYDTFPGEVFLAVAADALAWCGASRADPVPLEGIRDRFLAECSFRGRERRKLQYVILAAAALRAGTEPDLLDEVSWWQTDDFWRYALYAAVAYIRLAASQVGVPVSQVCRELAGSGQPDHRDGQVAGDAGTT
ncbi:MAG: hypothetical protein ACYCVZ_04955 [Streptosporangiaceae bacterium]